MQVRKRTRSSAPASPTSEVGYGKPPAHSRFSPGRSGNPKGRSRGSKSLSTYSEEELEKIVTANVDGKPVRLRMRSLIARKIALAAAKGSSTAQGKIIQLEAQSKMANEQAAVVARSVEPIVGPADEAILKRYRQELFEEFQRQPMTSSEPETDTNASSPLNTASAATTTKE